MMFFMAHSNFAATSQSEEAQSDALAGRGMQAEQAELDVINHPIQGTRNPASLHGYGVSRGRYEGRARIVREPADFEKIEAGDILVARTTSPVYNVLLPLLGAVVTDQGGVLCHAAIVADGDTRLAVVGTGNATSRIADGIRIVVDGERETVEMLA